MEAITAYTPNSKSINQICYPHEIHALTYISKGCVAYIDISSRTDSVLPFSSRKYIYLICLDVFVLIQSSINHWVHYCNLWIRNDLANQKIYKTHWGTSVNKFQTNGYVTIGCYRIPFYFWLRYCSLYVMTNLLVWHVLWLFKLFIINLFSELRDSESERERQMKSLNSQFNLLERWWFSVSVIWASSFVHLPRVDFLFCCLFSICWKRFISSKISFYI